MPAALSARTPTSVLRPVSAWLVLGLLNLPTPQALSQAAKGDSVSVVFKQMNVPLEVPFTKFTVEASFDPAKPDQAKVLARVVTGSFDFGKGAEDYNKEVQGKTWFDSATYPTAVFAGDGVTSKAGSYEMQGKLTVKGRTVPMTVPFRMTRRGSEAVFEGEFPLRRLAFGIGEGEWRDTSIVQDEVIVKFRITTAASNLQPANRSKP